MTRRTRKPRPSAPRRSDREGRPIVQATVQAALSAGAAAGATALVHGLLQLFQAR